MAESDLRTAFFESDGIKNPPSKPRAERAIGLAFWNMTRDDRVGVFLNDPVLNADAGQVIRQHLFRKIGLFLIEIDDQDLKFHRRTPLYIEQQIEHRVAVLPARKTHHHPIALVDHRKIGNGIAHFLEQFSFCLSLCKQLASYRLPKLPSLTFSN